MSAMGNRRLASVVLALAVGLIAQLTGQSRFTKQDGDRFQEKLSRINAFAAAPQARGSASSSRTAASAPASAQTTQLSDVEVNSYLRYNIKDQVPVGIAEPTLTALGDGRVRGGAVIDLDAVRSSKQRGWTDPMGYLRGQLPLTASGVLVTQNGIGRFQLESAEISGITVPKSLVQELLSYYSRSAENPNGIGIDDPFELPARIKEIRVGKGEAMVVQ
jgi:hypothetical protein